MSNRPALLGDRPIFEHKISVVRPLLPPFEEISEHLRRMLGIGALTKGEHLHAFEEMVAEHLQVKHAVAVSSCTTGLMLAYRALGLKGAAVVPSFTFMATVSALVLSGVRPVFADVDPATMNLSPEAAEAAITPETTAIVAVHNFGNPAEMEALQELAERRGLRLIFDAAQAFGSSHRGRPLGPQGDVQVYSLTPTKLLVAGEGGIVATNNDELAERVRVGREYGNDGSYNSPFAGLNGRLPEFNALMGRLGLPRLEEAARCRNLVAASYRARLSHLPGLSFQQVSSQSLSSYNYFSIMVDEAAFGLTRDELALALSAENIESRRYYDPPVHEQLAYREYSAATNALVHTELLARRVLCLPVWSQMEAEVVSGICTAVERAHEFAREIKARLKEEKRDEASVAQPLEWPAHFSPLPPGFAVS